MEHVMLDLETLGTRPGSAIRSVGAAAFTLGDPTAGPTFYKKVRSMSCWVAGLTVDQSTLDWWERQPQSVRDELKEGAEELISVVRDFHGWFNAAVGARYVWCQGAGFDEPLWTAAARAVGLAPPWKFWDVRCTRTIYQSAGLDPRTVARDGTHHNALDDALHQIKCVQRAHEIINAKRAS